MIREVALHDSFCAQGTYRLASGLPWYDVRDKFTKVRISWDMAYVKVPVNMRYWFYAYGGVTEVAGLGYLRHVHDMSFCFSSCGSLTSLDLRGFDPSELTDLGYAFASCAKLATITVNSTWALPGGKRKAPGPASHMRLSACRYSSERASSQVCSSATESKASTRVVPPAGANEYSPSSCVPR